MLYASRECNDRRTESSREGKVPCARGGSKLRNLIRRCGSCSSAAQRVPQHGVLIQLAWRLVQRPQGFAIIGVQFKELSQQLLWDLGRRQVHSIEGAEQGQQIESGVLQSRAQIGR